MRKKRGTWNTFSAVFVALIGLTGLPANALEGRPPIAVEWSEDRFFEEISRGND